MDKKEARKYYKEIRRNIPDEIKSAQSDEICAKLLDLIEGDCYNAILLYAPLKDEVDIMKVFDALHNKYDVYFPRVYEDNMDFYKVSSCDELESGYFGVREPSEKCGKLSLTGEDKAIMVVPGVAFDDRGFRIGYGKGFYDKYLSVHKEGMTTVGICFRECRMKEISNDEYDIPVDIIL